jgi:diguanylate cyclase (GGDEF)-like protein
MTRVNNSNPKGKLLFFALLGALSGILTFLILLIISEGRYWEINAAISIIIGLLIFTSTSTIVFYTLCKKHVKYVVHLKELSTTDRLTELYNRSYLEPFLEKEIETARRRNQKVSVIMVDMDHFKEINDSYGHNVGDHVLTIFAQVVLKCIRKTDVIARYGGDEFIVVLPNTDTDTARIIAERIRHDVENTVIPPIDNIEIPPIRCSVGISTYPEFCDSKNSLLKTSDAALYMAKRSGRNCIRVYQGV